MSERMPEQNIPDAAAEVTIKLTNGEFVSLAPHNTHLVEYDPPYSSRNHLYFYHINDDLDFENYYIFQSIDPENYDHVRKQILFNLDYDVSLIEQPRDLEESEYQQQIDKCVTDFRLNLPHDSLDFLITITK